MDHPKTYLLKAIAGYKTNDYNSFGQLHAKHVDDIAKIMEKFATEATLETIERLNKGEAIDVGGQVFTLKRIKQKVIR